MNHSVPFILILALTLLLLLPACAQTSETAVSAQLPAQTAEPEPTAPAQTADPTPTPEPVSLYGVWKYTDLDQYLEITPDGWSIYTSDGLYRTGLCNVDETARTVTLMLLDCTAFPVNDCVITFSADTGTDWDGDTLVPSALPESFPASAWDEQGLTGVWKYDSYPIWIVICSGGGWTQYTTDLDNYSDAYGSVLQRQTPMLFNTAGSLGITVSGDTAADGNGDTLHRVANLYDE